jgi:hypothetical protein
MRTIVLVGLLLVALTAPAAAGRGHGGSSSASSSRPSGRSSGQSSSSGSGRSSGQSSGGMSGTGSSSSSHVVKGYTTKRGAYVAPHQQTNPDHTQLNNYSTKGNVNPSNGKVGTKSATH